MFICASYSAQRTVFMNDTNALIDVVNIYFNLTIDIADSKVLINLITHGLCLPIAEYEAQYFVNSSIFNIVSKYLSSTCRFRNMPQNTVGLYIYCLRTVYRSSCNVICLQLLCLCTILVKNALCCLIYFGTPREALPCVCLLCIKKPKNTK